MKKKLKKKWLYTLVGVKFGKQNTVSSMKTDNTMIKQINDDLTNYRF